MKQNAHEQEQARVLAEEIGVDNLAFGTIVLPFGKNDAPLAEEWFTGEELHRRTRYDIQENDMRSPCWWLWRGLVINWDGSVFPCCYVARERIFGNINEASFMEIWNGAAYQSARGLFSGGVPAQTVCARCGIVAANGKKRRL
jgi:radical SAM protein with 4Fe4S-binding SPASM domain